MVMYGVPLQTLAIDTWSRSPRIARTPAMFLTHIACADGVASTQELLEELKIMCADHPRGQTSWSSLRPAQDAWGPHRHGQSRRRVGKVLRPARRRVGVFVLPSAGTFSTNAIPSRVRLLRRKIVVVPVLAWGCTSWKTPSTESKRRSTK